MHVPDINDAYRFHELEQEAWLAKRPKCDKCGEPIQDDYLYDVGGDIFCEECMKEVFRSRTENYEIEGE